MKNGIGWYVVVISASGLAASTILSIVEPRAESAYLIATLVFAALGLASELLTYELPKGGSASVAFLPFIAAALVSPTPDAVIAVGGALALNQVLNRRAAI